MTAHRTRCPVLWAGLPIVIIFMLLAACNYPGLAPAATATLSPSATPVPPTATHQAPSAVPPTALPPTATAAPTLVPTPKSQYRGVAAYDQDTQSISGVDFNGASLNISLKLAGAGWIGFNQAQWSNNSMFYVNPTNKTINQVANNGAAQKLAFIAAKDDLAFAISVDGKKIAWSFDITTGKNPASELWVANIDGTNAKQIDTIAAASNTKWLVLRPYRWMADGRLLYVEEQNGIGGYILFDGFSGMHLFDPANNKLTNLTPSLGSGNMCLLDVSPDVKTLVSACATSQHNDISFINLADNKVISLTRQAEQGVVGSPAWSPAGAWMAYAYARGEPDNEQGSVALVANGSSTPKILATLPNGSFNVAAWINENQFIVQRHEGAGDSIWLFNRDGTPPIKLSNGDIVSLVSN
jgi:hypothetical protein